MSFSDDLHGAGIDPTSQTAVVAYIAALPIPRDRREGLYRLWCGDQHRTPSATDVETVRQRPSP